MNHIQASEVPIDWHSDLPIFANESFLKSVGDEYGWIGGIDESKRIVCILPYTVIRKFGTRMVRFRVETIPLIEDFNLEYEKDFLTSAMNFLRSINADIIIPATTNTIFRTYPAGAIAAPYGSYVIDLLNKKEEEIWKGIDRITRQNINTAKKNGISIFTGLEYVDKSYTLVRETFKRSKIQFMSNSSFKQYISGLGDNCKIMIAEYKGVVHSCVVYAFSNYCAYAVYGGNISNQFQGANKLLHWEAIRLFRESGVHKYDFVGARIDPQKGSKQEALDLFKRHFGGTLRQGYIWKYPLRPIKSLSYSLGIRLLRKGDIVDNEHFKLSACSTK